MNKLWKNKFFLIYMFLLIAVAISFIFTNINYDVEYQLAMGYRILKGDRMITMMWEPHQTSAFFSAFLIWIYKAITGTTTGIVLFTQIVGIGIRIGLSVFLYRTLIQVADQIPSCIAAILYFLVSPKEVLTPEFGNMQLWFGTLLFLFLIRYIHKERIGYLVAGAVALCMGVLSYPSFLLTYFAAIAIIIKFSHKKVRDFILFTAVCVLIGTGFLCYVLIGNDITVLTECIRHALALEPSHTVDTVTKILSLLKDIGVCIGMLLAVAFIGFVLEASLCFIRRIIKKSPVAFSADRWMFLSWMVLLVLLLISILGVDHRGAYAFLFVVILAFGFIKRNLLTDSERILYICSIWISVMCLVSTLILSDNAFLQAVTYMLILICTSVLPLYRWFQKLQGNREFKRFFQVATHAFLCIIIFRCLFIHIPIYGRGQICSPLSDLALIRSGPAIGIVTDESGAARQRDSFAEWNNYVKDEDTIWIIGSPVDTLGYLYTNANVGAPTVMSTPTYNENLLYYWTLNPDKYPNVVILSSAFGELDWELKSNEWLMNWINEEYRADEVTDGNYWRYYRRNETN